MRFPCLISQENTIRYLRFQATLMNKWDQNLFLNNT